MDLIKLRRFSEDKTNVTQKVIFVFDRAENIVKKKPGVKAGYQYFPLLFSTMFLRSLPFQCP